MYSGENDSRKYCIASISSLPSSIPKGVLNEGDIEEDVPSLSGRGLPQEDLSGTSPRGFGSTREKSRLEWTNVPAGDPLGKVRSRGA
ncbi:hypothetical protein NW760_013072 [Fusarium oxysporum]|nr:hypothetical protein NW760_013072 [Fusarium oxysporum]